MYLVLEAELQSGEEKGEDEGRLMLQSTEIFDFHLTILNIYDIVNRR